MKFDNYNLEKIIWEDFFCKVYLTTKKDDPKNYATKVYDREKTDQTDEIKHYLQNEITILKHLNHPNIIKLHDIKKSKKYYYTIFEYCNGGHLSKALEHYIEKHGKPFPEEIIQHLMRQLINVLQYIHEKEIIHRQIYSDNILLNYENEEDAKNSNLIKAQIKIINFGCSAKLPKSGLVHDLVGYNKEVDPFIIKTLADKSSQLTKRGYNQSYDIWFIGSICYEMLTGKKIFDSDNLSDILDNIEKGIYSVPITTSYELISFITGMLQYSLKQRPTAAELSKHDFLNKDIKQFKKITDLKISNMLNRDLIEIDSKNNKCNLSIYNKYDWHDILNENLGNNKNKEPEKSNNQEKETNDISDKK